MKPARSGKEVDVFLEMPRDLSRTRFVGIRLPHDRIHQPRGQLAAHTTIDRGQAEFELAHAQWGFPSRIVGVALRP